MGKVRHGLTLVVMLTVLFGCVFVFYRGCVLANEMIVEPAVTQRLATDAIGEGWTVTHTDIYSDKYHRYIFKRKGERRDVNMTMDDGGKWSAQVAPVIR